MPTEDDGPYQFRDRVFPLSSSGWGETGLCLNEASTRPSHGDDEPYER
jgi:hypothetical protein